MVWREDKAYPPRGFDHALLLKRFDVISLKGKREIWCLRFLYKKLHNTVACPRAMEYFHLTPSINSSIQSPIWFMTSVFIKECDIHFDTLASITRYILKFS